MASINTKFKLIYIPLGFLLLVGILMIGVTDYITAGYDPAILKTSEFWINILTTNLGTIAMIISILITKIDKFKENDKDYTYYELEINTFRKEKYVSPMMQRFYFEDNLKTKIIYYKDKVNKEFSKIVPTDEDLKIYYGNDSELKEQNNYCKKMYYYDKVLSPEYINRVVPKMHLNYPQINDNIIFSGIINNSQLTDYITRHKIRKIILDYLPRFLFAFSLTILGSGLVPDFKEITSAVIIRTAIKLFTICSQIFFSISYANKYNKEVTLHDIMFRHKKLNEYIVWEHQQINKVKGGSNVEERSL